LSTRISFRPVLAAPAGDRAGGCRRQGGAGCLRRRTTARSSSGGSRRWISARPSWSAAYGYQAHRRRLGHYRDRSDWPDQVADGLRLRLLLTHQRPAAARRPAGAGWTCPETA